MIILGNKFDGNTYEVEDTKTGEVQKFNLEEVIDTLKGSH